MLMASLPHLGQLFTAERPPISRLKLEQRLGLLDDDDRATLARIEDLLQWDHLPMERTDRALLGDAQRLLEVCDRPVLRQIVTARLDNRAIIAALRRRHRGEPAPGPREAWAPGTLPAILRQHWSDPGFGLRGARPWIAAAQRHLDDDDPLEFEKLVTRNAWLILDRLAGGHEFDFEAVVIYVMKWNLIHRWTDRDGSAAVDRFDRMVREGLGPAATLFAPQEQT